MKKILALLLALALMASTFALVACKPETDEPDDPKPPVTDPDDNKDPDDDKEPVEETTVAYGIVHGGYVGIGTLVTLEDEIKSATIDEACLPSYIHPAEASDFTAAGTSHGSEVLMYKTIKFADAEWTFDTAANDYVNADGEAMVATMKADADLCEAYAKAVLAGEVYALTATDTWADDVFTAAALMKTQNGYWAPGGHGLGWAANVKATCDYIVANGFEALYLTKNDNSIFVDDNGVVTGATWSDMYDYVNLLRAAAELNSLTKAVANVAYGIVHGGYVGIGTMVTIGNDVVVAGIDEACLPSYVHPAEASDFTANGTSHGSDVLMYKTVKFADAEWTFDTTANDYVNADGEAMVAVMKADAELCETYAKAVLAGEVYALTATDTWADDVFTAAALMKTQNGYWAPGGHGLGWAANVKATCDYIVANGFEALTLTKNDDGIFVDDNDVVTGATWSDMYDYVNLLRTAADLGKLDKVTGEYSYEAYGNTYGAKVDVYLADGKIATIKLYTDEETGWHNLSDANAEYGWTEEARQVWIDGQQAYLDSFVGMTVADALELTATINGVDGDTANLVDGINGVTGATQSSARVILAMQNALAETLTGEYSYEAWGHTYGAKVDVQVVGGKIVTIKLYTDEETGWCNLSAAVDGTPWTDEARQVWIDGQQAYLNSFVGMTVAEAQALVATISGVADADANLVDGMDYVTGATQSSARVILALQDALAA